MKYNIEQARKENKNTIFTFGGAYSNHITATAAAGKLLGFKTIGLIRGEEHLPLNKSLQFAKDCGMILHYVNRNAYKSKEIDYAILHTHYAIQPEDIYILPEGGEMNWE